MEYTTKYKVSRNRYLSTTYKSTRLKRQHRTVQRDSLTGICLRMRDGMDLEDTEPDIFKKQQTGPSYHASSVPQPEFQYSTSSFAAQCSLTNKGRYCYIKPTSPIHPDDLTQPVLRHTEESSHTNHTRVFTKVNSSSEDLLHCSLCPPESSSSTRPYFKTRNDVPYEGYHSDNSEQEDTIIEWENIFPHPIFQIPISYPDTNFSNQLLGLTARIYALTAEMEFATSEAESEYETRENSGRGNLISVDIL